MESDQDAVAERLETAGMWRRAATRWLAVMIRVRWLHIPRQTNPIDLPPVLREQNYRGIFTKKCQPLERDWQIRRTSIILYWA
ncbi:PerC family transcriptional regulator [Klebsiella aerogenes]|uniref:PerC family transcriptional regulator n=1 Tax=Klebsiella aerogenes TaxID=548 RepID=UPI002E366B8C|nr:PerC family transcriptional regulator [Klebsiella aerogenes]MED7793198.1 PerC family transcriptional regulator [Klebsiella aerogenes]